MLSVFLLISLYYKQSIVITIYIGLYMADLKQNQTYYYHGLLNYMEVL